MQPLINVIHSTKIALYNPIKMLSIEMEKATLEYVTTILHNSLANTLWNLITNLSVKTK